MRRKRDQTQKTCSRGEASFFFRGRIGTGDNMLEDGSCVFVRGEVALFFAIDDEYVTAHFAQDIGQSQAAVGRNRGVLAAEAHR